MNPTLLEYTSRYAPTKPIPKPYLENFFTNLDVSNHFEYLPYLFDIQNVCLRLGIALIGGQKVCIYSDYDTDAVTATGVMYHGLIDLGFESCNLEFYAPDRFTEGYGMNTEAARELASKFDLVISVDCGINSTLEADIFAKSKCDLIITDHHHLQSQTPKCIGVVNCRLAKEYHDSKELKRAYLENFAKIKKYLFEESKLTTKKYFPTNYSSINKKIKSWYDNSILDSDEFGSSPQRFLSSSVTGVGVAWFVVVWFGYFLEYTKDE